MLNGNTPTHHDTPIYVLVYIGRYISYKLNVRRYFLIPYFIQSLHISHRNIIDIINIAYYTIYPFEYVKTD